MENYFTDAIKMNNIHLAYELFKLYNTGTINQIRAEGSTPLIYAVKMDKNIDVIRFIISKNGGVNRCNRSGQSPLHFARNAAVVKLLIQSGANVNCIDNSGSTPLMTLMKSLKDKKGLFYLLRRGADTNICNVEGQNALHLALTLKLDTSLVLKILNGMDATHINSEDETGYTPLQYAFENFSFHNKKEIKIIFELINKGCKASKKVFMLALKVNGFSEIVKKLVDYVDVKDCIDSEGRNVLHLVQDVDLVKLLVRKGGLINHRDNKGISPLVEAVSCFKDVELIESLLCYGAEVDSVPYLVDFIGLFFTKFTHVNLVVDLLVLHGMNISSKKHYIKIFVSKIFALWCNDYLVLAMLKCSLFCHILISNENIIFPKVFHNLISPSTVDDVNSLIDNYKNEIHKMKKINIIDTVSFYDFCLTEHKLLRCCIDDSNCKYMTDNYKKIKEDFPNFFAQIIIKIKINLKIQNRRALLKKLLSVSIKCILAKSVHNTYARHLRSNSKSTFPLNFVELNCDCLYNVGNYLHDRDLRCLLGASM